MPTAFHRIRFQRRGGVEVDLEWTKGRGVPVALPELPSEVLYVELEATPDAAALEGVPPICFRDDCPALFEQFQLRENTDYFVDITLPISRTTAESEIAEKLGWPFGPRLGNVFQADPPRRWRQDNQGRLVVSGLIHLRNYAGILDLRIDADDSFRAEVVCQKIGYLSEFNLLLERVAEELAELLLQYDSPVSVGFNTTDATSGSEAALLFQIRHVMAAANLPSSVDEILGRFHTRLHTLHSFIEIEEVDEPDVQSLSSELDLDTLKRGGALQRFFRGYTPLKTPVLQQHETTDTAENRYVKYFLEELLLVCRRLRERLQSMGKLASAAEAAGWVDQLEEMLFRSAWRDVGRFRQFPSNSQMLQKGRGYRDILKYDLSMRMGLSLPWKRAGELAEGIEGDLRPVSELYEYWCFFVLRRALAEICVGELSRKGSLIYASADGLRVQLRKGRRSKIVFVYKEAANVRVEINLFYNRRFQRPNRPLSSWLGSYTANFDPDYSIEIVSTTSETVKRHWLHFDAKYRLDRSVIHSMLQEEPVDQDEDEYLTELRRVHKQDDLFKMHTYRDGILGSRGAYILYPGDEDGVVTKGEQRNIFVRHPSALGGETRTWIPSVGAFSLSPAKEAIQRQAIAAFIRETVEALSSGTSYTEESGTF